MKKYLKIIGRCVLVAWSFGVVGAQERENQRPNIVLFLVDDLGWADVGCYGSSFYETPNIDRLAEEGVRFRDAYAACHVCSPTRASILTGKYPATLNLTDWLPGRRDFPFQRLKNVEIQQRLPDEETTLAEALKVLGYSTAIFGKWHLGRSPSTPLAHGFDVAIPNVPSNWRTFHGPFGMENLPSAEGDYLTDRLTDEAVQWMGEQSDQPFFLYMAHFAVHDPIEGREDLVDKYRDELERLPEFEGPKFVLEANPDDPNAPSTEALAELIETPEFERHKVLPRGTIKIKQRQDNVEFAAMVEAVDESLGRIVKRLEEMGAEENTVVIFFSDNGGMAAMNVGNPRRVVPESNVDKAYSTSNLPLRGAKGWLYEGGIRVPMIVKWPGEGQVGVTNATPVSSVDFLPTILDMIGETNAVPDGVDGVSIAPLIQGRPMRERALFWHFPHYSNHGMQSPGGAIRRGNYKLLEYFENGSVQLFDLDQDIGERRDLAEVEVDVAESLRAELRAWRTRVNARMMPPNPDYDPSIKPEDF